MTQAEYISPTEQSMRDWRERLDRAEAALPRPTAEDLARLPGCVRTEELRVEWEPHPQWRAELWGYASGETLLVACGPTPWRARHAQYEVATWPEAVALVLAAWDRDRGVSC